MAKRKEEEGMDGAVLPLAEDAQEEGTGTPPSDATEGGATEAEVVATVPVIGKVIEERTPYTRITLKLGMKLPAERLLQDANGRYATVDAEVMVSADVDDVMERDAEGNWQSRDDFAVKVNAAAHVIWENVVTTVASFALNSAAEGMAVMLGIPPKGGNGKNGKEEIKNGVESTQGV